MFNIEIRIWYIFLSTPSVCQNGHIAHTHEIHTQKLNAVIEVHLYVLFGVLQDWVISVVIPVYKLSNYVLLKRERY